MRRTFFTAFVLILCPLSPVPALCSNQFEVQIENVLMSDPAPIRPPLFGDSLDIEEIINCDFIARENLWPRAGSELPWFSGGSVLFSKQECKEDEIKLPYAKESPSLVYIAVYLDNKRYQKIKLQVAGKCPFGCYINGEEKMHKYTKDDSPQEAEFELRRGKYLLLIKALLPDDSEETKTVQVTMTSQYENQANLDIKPTRGLSSYDDLRSIISVSDLAVSPDGGMAAIVLSSRKRNGEPARTYLELWDLKNKRQRSTILVGRTTSMPVFSPDSKELLFKSSGDEGYTLWLMNLRSGKMRSVVQSKSSISGPTFSPDGKSVFFLGRAQTEENSDGTPTVYKDLRDKLRDWYKNRVLFELDLATGAKRKVTSPGDYMIAAFALSEDGKKIAYSRMIPIERRPFFATEIWVQELSSGIGRKIRTLATGFENSPLNLAFCPKGKKLAFTSTPDTVGDNTGLEHNIYNSDLYVLDLNTGELNKITKEFAPSLVERSKGKSVTWHRSDGRIYFLALDRTRQQIFRTDSSGKNIENITKNLSVTNVDFFSNIASNGVFISSSSSFSNPPAVYIHNIRSKSAELLEAPNEPFFEDISLGSVENFDFTNRRGDKITGWIFKPVSFEPNRKYPLIVYYYGGVAPRLERFSFAYHWLCANGYVVYVLNPSGAYGSGDNFADLHVDDWGTLASADIIQGVKKILAEKPYLDSGRVGAYGGSYGGFITMDLATKTTLFKALCSMYGISDLASYWGAGMWGFTYGDMAMAGKYPWKDKDFFVDKSPLYNAEKVSTPILFLHGDSDVNVPPGQSRQLFTALRVLGKDAVLVEFAGEDHGIAGSMDDFVAHREIMLDWFDKYLKGEPDAWNARWSE